jgi:hypothetical protein
MQWEGDFGENLKSDLAAGESTQEGSEKCDLLHGTLTG